MSADTAPAAMPGHIPDTGKMVSSPAAMPGEEEIAELLVSAHASLATPQNTARAILAFFAPILAEKEREIRELTGRLAVRMDYLVGLATTADRHVETAAESRALAAEAALAAEREKVTQVLEPFDDALGEDDEGYGDGLTVVMKWGACTDYSVTLADLRDVRKLAAAIRAQGE